MPEQDLHVVVGTGPVGRAVIGELIGRGLRVRAVARHGVAEESAGVETLLADITDPDAAGRAMAGATVVHHAASAPYHRWPELLPPLMHGLIAGAKAAGAPVVYADNLYVYGPVDGPLTEDLPARAAGPNGLVRAALAAELMEAHARDNVRAAIGRASDFYGPCGDPVFGFNRHRFGTYAQYVCWPEDGLLATRPANLTDDEAAAIPYGGLLALHFLRKAGVRAGHRVLIYGASGAVGTSAAQLARHFGAEVTGVCSAANVDLVASLGATTVIDYTREDFTDQATRYDLIFDAVGKRKSAAALRQCRQVLALGGTCVSVDDGTPDLRREDLVLLGELATKGEIRPVIDRTYALDDIVDAHRYVDNGHKRGNVVITVP